MASPLQESDVVWARVKGYPWWPAVLTSAPAPPNLGRWQTGLGNRITYHCTFLAWNKERAWLEGTEVKRFKREDVGEGGRKVYVVKKKQLMDLHLEAIELALEILDDPDNAIDHLMNEECSSPGDTDSDGGENSTSELDSEEELSFAEEWNGREEDHLEEENIAACSLPHKKAKLGKESQSSPQHRYQATQHLQLVQAGGALGLDTVGGGRQVEGGVQPDGGEMKQFAWIRGRSGCWRKEYHRGRE